MIKDKTCKKLPESELDIMLILWAAEKPVSRAYIEKEINKAKALATTTILSLISRLENKGFIKPDKSEKTYLYSPVISERDYKINESTSVLKKLYNNSIKNFITALYEGDNISNSDIEELEEYVKKLKEDSYND